jgi:hypothetical protein
MANLTSSQIKDSYQSVLTTSETTSDPTTGTLQNGKGTAITALGVSGTVTATKLIPSGGDATGNGLYLATTNALGLSTAGSERMRIDASGNVGVGATSPASKLHVRGSAVDLRIDDTQAYNFGTSGPQLFFTGLDSSSTLTLFGSIVGTPQNGNPDRGYLNIRTRVEGVNTQTLQIGTGFSADVIVNTGNLGVGVTPTSRNNTRLQIVDGIGFPATQVASSDPNTLDDYEEGTFDFGISFGGSSTGVTYGNRQGKYTKIGRQVSVTGFISLTSKGAEVGNAKITGLPFLIGGDSSNNCACVLRITDITFANVFMGNGDTSASTISLLETTEAGGAGTITNTDFADNSTIILSLTYFVS